MNPYLLFCLFLGLPFALQSSCCGGVRKDPEHVQTLQRDNPSKKEFVDSKRSTPLNEITDCLSFSGDVRATWAHLSEKIQGASLRGSSSAGFIDDSCSCPNTVRNGEQDPCLVKFPHNVYEMEFNFYVDYSYKNAWAVSWLQFNNIAGLQGSKVSCCKNKNACRGSGTCEGVCLKKAYIGCNLISDGCVRFDIEIGRRPLWTVFDSYIQFNSRFDGILGFFALNLPQESDFYMKGGPFVIDERAHHYGGVVETGLLNLFGQGLDIKYSFIHWSKDGPNRCGVENALGNQYNNSQLTLAYFLDSCYTPCPIKLYAAGLYNHKAQAQSFTLGKRENWAGYAGILCGRVCQAGDWSIDLCYQYVQALAIPDCDISGISNGNVQCEYIANATTAENARGRGNYSGLRLECLYAWTDNLALDLLAQASRSANKNIGGKHEYAQVQLQAIYAF